MTDSLGALWRTVIGPSRTSGLEQLSSTKALQLVNQLNGVGLEGIDLPRIVVVGMQSSGKSSLLNAIMGLDLMPTGGEMVTRVPLDLRLERDLTFKSKGVAEFGSTDAEGQWNVKETIEMDVPLMSVAQVARIRRTIELETELVAGKEKGISNKPIHLRLRASHLPNLSLVDLPGLTMVACTDKGQPPDIKEQIRNLVKEWASPARTIIACVMPARTDLEADAALDLVKEINPDGKRIVGVITKPDLMATGSDITKYLRGTVSRDLQLGLGYYCIRGRSTERTLAEAEAAAEAYFQSPPYTQTGDRCGTTRLTAALAAALADYVRQHLPQVCEELNAMLTRVEDERARLGTPPPTEANERMRVLQRTLLALCSDSCEDVDRGDAGLDLLTQFQAFRDTISTLNLVSPHEHQERLTHLLRGVRGNHMSNGKGCPVQALESLFLERPELFASYRVAAMNLVTQCVQRIRASLDEAFAKHGWNDRFPQLVAHIHTIVSTEILQTRSFSSDVDALIERESSYLWTDDPEFRDLLTQPVAGPGPDEQLKHVARLIQAYTAFLGRLFGNAVPKLVMVRLVRPYLRTAGVVVVEPHTTLMEHFCEPSLVANKRSALLTRHQQISTMLQLCDTIFQYST